MDCKKQRRWESKSLKAFATGSGADGFSASPDSQPVIGVIEGTGIGPEIIRASLGVLKAVEQVLGTKFELRHGGPIGEEAEALCGCPLPDSVVTFCKDVFAQNGAILSGPGGRRYVYDQRKVFDLFCKFVPVRPWPELANAGVLSKQHMDADILIVRDNTGGVYQGRWQTFAGEEGTIAEHSFSYSELQVRRLTEVACRAAASRSGRMHVIVKQDGVPAISELWQEVSRQSAEKYGVEAVMMNVDLAAYEIVGHPSQFDVIATPNLFGDILVDVSGVLTGSRGATFSGNFGVDGKAVYQTNHGSAHDMAGKDIANPAGQILSLAMLLRESFGLFEAASLIEGALSNAWRQGWRTLDLAAPGCRIAGMQEMGERVAQEVFNIADSEEAACARHSY